MGTPLLPLKTPHHHKNKKQKAKKEKKKKKKNIIKSWSVLKGKM